MNKFAFLYPDEEIFKAQVEFGAKKGDIEEYSKRYKQILNACIDQRYRKKGFAIHYVVFSDRTVSGMIDTKINDIMLDAGMTFEEHIPNGKKADYASIFPKIIPVDKLVLGGFYVGDCVEEFAKKAHGLGIDTLIDEDLTDLLPLAIKRGIKTDSYPNFDPRTFKGAGAYEHFIKSGKDKPWLYQY